MLLLLAVALVNSVLAVNAGPQWDAIKVKFPVYIGIPLNTVEAKAAGWKLITSDTTLNVDIFQKSNDFTYMILFDKKGYIAGLRCGVGVVGVDAQAKQNHVPFPNYYDQSPMWTKQKKNKDFGCEFWYSDVLFQSIAQLKSGGRASLVIGKDEVALGVFMKLNGVWTEINKDETKVEAQGFVKQYCVPAMGQHYFYKFNKETDCAKVQGFFVGYEKGKLVLAGMFAWGKFTSSLNYLEIAPLSFIKLVFSNKPACLEDLGPKIGAFSTHIYLTSNPAAISCPKLIFPVI